MQDLGQCVGELVVMRGDCNWGVTGIYFSWWWDLGQCVGELVVMRG